MRFRAREPVVAATKARGDTACHDIPGYNRAVLGHAIPRPLRFVLVGGATYAINVAAFAALVDAGLSYALAALAAYAAGFGFNFGANRAWTFSARGGEAWSDLRRFSVLGAALLLVDISLLHVAESFRVDVVVAQAVAILLLAPISFFGNRLWAFGQIGRAAG